MKLVGIAGHLSRLSRKGAPVEIFVEDNRNRCARSYKVSRTSNGRLHIAAHVGRGNLFREARPKLTFATDGPDWRVLVNRPRRDATVQIHVVEDHVTCPSPGRAMQVSAPQVRELIKPFLVGRRGALINHRGSSRRLLGETPITEVAAGPAQILPSLRWRSEPDEPDAKTGREQAIGEQHRDLTGSENDMQWFRFAHGVMVVGNSSQDSHVPAGCHRKATAPFPSVARLW
jgi:hypothetical protein